MKKLILAVVAILVSLTGCARVQEMRQHLVERANYTNPFYLQYLSPSRRIDRDIYQKILALREDASSPALHNDLGRLLYERGFYADAESEFERAIALDRRFYSAWYNLGLTRQAQGRDASAAFALRRAVRIRPGHSEALFALGMMAERRGDNDRALDFYTRAFAINKRLLEVEVNPRIVDSRLVDLALLRLYPIEHRQESAVLQPTPGGYQPPPARPAQDAPSRVPTPSEIVTPAPPDTANPPADQGPGQIPPPDEQ